MSTMTERARYIGPEDEGEPLEPGDELVVPVAEDSDRRQTLFEAVDSEEHDNLVAVEEVVEDERLPRAKAYFRRGKAITHELTPDHIRGDEGRRFLRIAGALAAAAATGASAYVVIRKKTKK